MTIAFDPRGRTTTGATGAIGCSGRWRNTSRRSSSVSVSSESLPSERDNRTGLEGGRDILLSIGKSIRRRRQPRVPPSGNSFCTGFSSRRLVADPAREDDEVERDDSGTTIALFDPPRRNMGATDMAGGVDGNGTEAMASEPANATLRYAASTDVDKDDDDEKEEEDDEDEDGNDEDDDEDMIEELSW